MIMIKVLKANKSQYKSLNGLTSGNSKLEFIKDAGNNWIIGKSVLTDPVWSDKLTQLNQLTEINYNPVITKL